MAGGRTVFYGAPEQARAHFESLGYRALPRQSTADYLTGCTDPHERQFAPGRSADNVPATPEALENAFRETTIAKELYKSVADYKKLMETDKTDQEAFRAAVLDDKKKGVTKTSPYTRSLHEQIWAMTVRVFQEKLQDKFQIITSFGLTTLLALILGSAYFNQPLNSNGGFTRSSTLFIGLLTVALDGMSEMPILMLGRPLVGKHVSRLYVKKRINSILIENRSTDELPSLSSCRSCNRQHFGRSAFLCCPILHLRHHPLLHGSSEA